MKKFQLAMLLLLCVIGLVTVASLMSCGDESDLGGFIRGDANLDGSVDLADSAAISNFLANAGGFVCLDALDVNDDGIINPSDTVYLSNYLFNGGPAPLPPFPNPGQDFTQDPFNC